MPTMAIPPPLHYACHPMCTHSYQPAAHCFSWQCLQSYTSELAEYAELSKRSDDPLWQQANTAKIHYLAQGTIAIPGTNTMFFIPVAAIPHGHHFTYLHIICIHWPKKAIPHHVCLAATNCVEYLGDVSTKTTDIITDKLLFNSMVSTPGGWCMMGDLKDFYLGTPMLPSDYAYMCIPVAVLPPDIMGLMAHSEQD